MEITGHKKMTSGSQDLSQTLVCSIGKAIQDELSLSEIPELAFRIIYDDDRRIYKIKIKGQPLFYVLKIRGIKVVKQQDLDLQDLQKEYDLLTTAWNSAKSMNKGYSMSKPVALWLDEKAMLMSGCEGKNLNDIFNQHLLKWAVNISDFEKAIYDCGFWLGNYHQQSSQTKPLQSEFDNRQSHLQRMIEFLKKNHHRHSVSTDMLDKIGHQFNKMTHQDATGPLCQVHGNFAYRNILYSANITNLVDFEDAHYEHVAFDIGQFLAEMMFKSQFPWLRHRTRRLVTAFKSGYQKNMLMQESITEAYVAYHLVVHLYEHCSRKNVGGAAGLILKYRIAYLGKLNKKWLKQSI